MTILMLFSLGILFYVYFGYYLILKVAVTLAGAKNRPSYQIDRAHLPSVTVLLTVFNEEKKVAERIKNILECFYPPDKLDILVASDGSTDNTDRIVSSFQKKNVKLFRPKIREGKTATQNQAVKQTDSDIIVFTDAATRFDKNFLMELVQPFSVPEVGGVDGHLQFLIKKEMNIARSQGLYWSQELKVRALESKLGILAVASGACLAVRRSLFRPMPPTVGEDCVIPLDVVSQGFKMIHSESALAYDFLENNPEKELKTRIRMTLRNWQGTWAYPHLLNPFKYPGLAFSLWSHKILRWLSPFFLMGWLTSSFYLLFLEGSLSGMPAVFFVALGIIGSVSNSHKKSAPLASQIYSFCFANLGFFLGVVQAISGKKITKYR